MGGWKTFANVLKKVPAIAQALPLPDKIKTAAEKIGHAEQDIEDAVKAVKPPKPPPTIGV